MLNSKMFDILKGQFVSNLNQDLLALSGFCDEDEMLSIIEKAMDMVRNRFNDNVKRDADDFVDQIVKDALKDSKDE